MRHPLDVFSDYRLFNHAVETNAAVEGVLDVAEGYALAFVVGLDAVGGDAVLVDEDAFYFVGTFLGEFHVVLVATSVVGEANHHDVDTGVVFEDASNCFDFVVLAGRYLPLVDSVEDGEGHGVEVELVGFDLVDDGLQAVGSSAVASFGLIGTCLGKLILELGNAVLKFLFVVTSVVDLTLKVVDLRVEGAEVLLGEEGFLGGDGLVGSAEAEVVHVAYTDDGVGVVPALVGVDAMGEDIGDVGEVHSVFGKDGAVFAEAIACTETSVEEDGGFAVVADVFTDTLTLGVVVVEEVAAEFGTCAEDSVEVEATVGVVAKDGVVDGDKSVDRDSPMAIHLVGAVTVVDHVHSGFPP